MAEQEHATRKPKIAAGIVVGLVIAALFSWLFAALDGVSVTTAAVILVFVLLAGWTVVGGLLYGPAEDGAEAH